MAKIKLVGLISIRMARKARRLGRIVAKRMSDVGIHETVTVHAFFRNNEDQGFSDYVVAAISQRRYPAPEVVNNNWNWSEIKKWKHPKPVPRVRKKIILKPSQENQIDNC